MIVKTDKLNDFLNFSAQDPIKEPKSCIIKFVQKIEPQLVDKALSAINYTPKNYFFWDNPESNETFLAIDECARTNNAFSINNVNVVSNQKEFPDTNIPDFIFTQKFPTEKNDEIWSDYEFINVFIPKLIFHKKNKEHILILFFTYHDFKTNDHFIEEIEEYLTNILNNQNNITDEPTIDVRFKTEFSEWKNMVEYSLSKINEKEIKKVVLSRLIIGFINSNPDLINLTKKLKKDYPDSYIFIYKKNRSTFLGVSPEKLISIKNNIIETEALAGTIARGESEVLDNELTEIILNDNKELMEHKNVVDYIIRNLSEFATEIEYQKPSIKKLKYVQHLWTPIKGKLKPNQSIYSIINKLHPTPAICGDPKEKALKLINNLEKFDRGLFTGLLGWYNKNGFGEIAVAIRSALIKNNNLHLFAGCGIVEGSTPEKEFTETELKLKSILSLFENESTNQS